MAEKALQKPSIIEVIGEFIRIAHPIISGNIQTRLATSLAAAGTALSVLDSNGFTDADDVLFGAVGDTKTEAGVINGAVSIGTSITVANSNDFAHELNCPFIKLNEDQITIFDAADDSEIATINIQWDKDYTEYEIAAADQSDTGYYVKFTDGTNVGEASDTVTSAGLADNSVYNLVTSGLDLIDEELGGKFSNSWAVRTANNCQDAITHYVRKTRAGVDIVKNWSFELAEDDTSISLTENENKYALSGLSFDLKQEDTKRSIQSVKIGSKQLTYIDIDEYDRLMENTVKTAVKTAITAADTEIVLDDTYELSETGVVYIGADAISYTGNTEATGTLTGCTDVDNSHSVDATVWQNVSPTLPTKYTIFNGNLYLDAPVDTDYVGYKLKIRGLQILARFADLSDTADIKFYNLFHYFIAARGEFKKGNIEEGNYWMNEFKSAIKKEALRDSTPILEEFIYKS